jgi:hypothetical protein
LREREPRHIFGRRADAMILLVLGPLLTGGAIDGLVRYSRSGDWTGFGFSVAAVVFFGFGSALDFWRFAKRRQRPS